jgi:hypothetical protein
LVPGKGVEPPPVLNRTSRPPCGRKRSAAFDPFDAPLERLTP